MSLKANHVKYSKSSANNKIQTSLCNLVDRSGSIFFFFFFFFFCFRFWPGLGLPRPKAIVVIPQNQPLPKHLRKKTSKSAKHACHYATKERPVKITMYLGLDIIIKIKFTTIFDRCAI